MILIAVGGLRLRGFRHATVLVTELPGSRRCTTRPFPGDHAAVSPAGVDRSRLFSIGSRRLSDRVGRKLVIFMTGCLTGGGFVVLFSGVTGWIVPVVWMASFYPAFFAYRHFARPVSRFETGARPPIAPPLLGACATPVGDPRGRGELRARRRNLRFTSTPMGPRSPWLYSRPRSLITLIAIPVPARTVRQNAGGDFRMTRKTVC